MESSRFRHCERSEAISGRGREIASSRVARLAMTSGHLQHAHQAPRILRRRALLVVVEIDIDRAPRPPPFADLTCVSPELRVGIIVLVGSARTVAAHIDMARRRLPWRGRVVVIRNAQRDVAVAQKVRNPALIPAPLPALEPHTLAP